jgi:hypothetical protein
MLLEKTRRMKIRENCKIPKSEGEHTIEGHELESVICAKPLRTRKVNIGIEDKPKFANIGDYWNEETVEKIVDLLHEYRGMFSAKSSAMKGIVGELGEMKISLKPYAKPVKQRPYKLNPIYKQKVKVEIHMILDTGQSALRYLVNKPVLGGEDM